MIVSSHGFREVLAGVYVQFIGSSSAAMVEIVTVLLGLPIEPSSQTIFCEYSPNWLATSSSWIDVGGKLHTTG
jgi:hypothetical protein